MQGLNRSPAEAKGPVRLRRNPVIAIREFPDDPIPLVLYPLIFPLDGQRVEQRPSAQRFHPAGALHEFRLEAEVNFHLLFLLPDLFLRKEAARLCLPHFSPNPDPGRPGESRNADGQGKGSLPFRQDPDLQAVPERIPGVHDQAHLLPVHLGLHPCGRQGRHRQALFGAHHGGKGELRPTLVEIGGATAEIGLQAEHMRFPAVGIEGILLLGQPGTLHLIGHLDILMGPHVRADGSRQGVESRLLQHVSPEGMPADGKQLLVGIHGLHNAAALAALERAGSRQALIPREMSHGHAVLLRQLPVERQRKGIGVLPGQKAHLRPGLQRHGHVHHMVHESPVILRPRPLKGKL